MQEKYDTIGVGYNLTRKADPYITGRLFHHLGSKPGGLYLDIGCGTGNYTHALQQKGCILLGVDPSAAMLSKAKRKNATIKWSIGRAENTGLQTNSVHGIIATLTLHHWSDLKKGFGEMSRVIRKKGNIIIFTATPQQMKGYWLNHYFPEMLKDSIHQMPALEKIDEAMKASGFNIITTEKYIVQPDLEDLFLYSGKHRPGLYLKPEVRSGISSFSALANADEVHRGLEALKADINSGEIHKIIRSYENTWGDYLFIIGKKA